MAIFGKISQFDNRKIAINTAPSDILTNIFFRWTRSRVCLSHMTLLSTQSHLKQIWRSDPKTHFCDSRPCSGTAKPPPMPRFPNACFHLQADPFTSPMNKDCCQWLTWFIFYGNFFFENCQTMDFFFIISQI